jgi:hypothetical protein
MLLLREYAVWLWGVKMFRVRWVLLARAIVTALLCSLSLYANAQTPNPVQRFDVVIGAMCIGDMPLAARVLNRTIQQGSDVYEDWTVDWTAAPPTKPLSDSSAAPTQHVPGNRPGSTKAIAQPAPAKGRAATPAATSTREIRPIIRFFRQVPPNSPGTSCREMKGDVLLSGDVNRIRLSARTSAPGNRSPAQIVVNPEGLSVTVGHVHSGLAPLFGGIVDLSGSQAWIEQYVTLRGVENSPPEGAIEITSWARRIKGAKFVLQAGLPPVSLDMSSSRENVTIKVPLDGSYTELIDGGFSGSPPAITATELNLPSATFSNASVDVGTLEVERTRRQQTNLVLSRTSIRYGSAQVYSPNSSISMKSAGAANVDRVAAVMQPAATVIALESPVVEGLLAKGSDCAAQIAKADLVKSATCTAKVTQPSGSSTQIEVATEDLVGTGFDHAFYPNPTTTLSYRIDRQGDRETFSGRMAPVSGRFGAIQTETLQGMAFQPTPLGAPPIRIPISIDIPSASGQLSLKQGNDQIVLSGRIDQVKLDAVLAISADASDPWSVIVDPNNLAFAASALVSTVPLVYGGETQLVGVGIRFVNSTQLSISRTRKTGQVLFTPSVLTVLDPKLQLAKTKEGITIRAPAKFDASPTLAINVEDGSLSVRSGHLLIENASAATSADGFADIGDVRVKAAEVGFQRLNANYVAGLGTLQIDEFKATADEVGSLPPSRGGNFASQIQWSGKPNGPIRFGSFQATVLGEVSKDALHIESYTIKDFCVAVSDARYGDPAGFSAVAQQIQFCAPILATNAIKADFELTDGKAQGQSGTVAGSLVIQKFALHLTAGTPAKPSGSGQLALGPIDLSMDTPVEIKQSCIDVPDFQKLAARTKFSAAATVAGVNIVDGQMNGGAAVILPKASLESSGGYDCRGALINWLLVKEQRVSYDYPCPTWSQPFRFCRGWTILVPEVRVTIDSRLQIYKLLVNYLAPLTELRIRSEDGKAKVLVCLGAVNMTNPLIAASYIVQPRTSVPGFDRFMGNILSYVVTPFESALGTALGNFGALVLNFLDATGIRENCFK